MKTLLCAASIAAIIASSPLAISSAMAQDHTNHDRINGSNHASPGPIGFNVSGGHDGHGAHASHGSAPIGVMGAHMHKKGEWMVSYRYMRMEMEGQRNGTDDLSPEDVVTNFSNPNAPPAGLRVVPTRMSTDMHMLGAMYGVTDWLTLAAMGTYLKRDMDHITFAGGAGTTRLGEFTTRSSGFGDTRVGGLVRLYDDKVHHLHANIGLSLPTGSITEEDDVLAPTGARPTLRLPYAMQLGSGTFDALPGLTYTGASKNWGWGAQYNAVIRLESENSEGYSLGDRHAVSAWGTYRFAPWLSGNTRLTLETIDSIDGADPLITAPVTTADPDNYGGEFASIGVGLNITPAALNLDGHEFGVEATLPVYQDLNGPQLERDYAVTAGWMYRF